MENIFRLFVYYFTLTRQTGFIFEYSTFICFGINSDAWSFRIFSYIIANVRSLSVHINLCLFSIPCLAKFNGVTWLPWIDYACHASSTRLSLFISFVIDLLAIVVIGCWCHSRNRQLFVHLIYSLNFNRFIWPNYIHLKVGLPKQTIRIILNKLLPIALPDKFIEISQLYCL